MTNPEMVKGPQPGAAVPGRTPQEPNPVPGQPTMRPNTHKPTRGHGSPDDPAVPTAQDPLDSPQHKPMLNE